MRAGMVVRRPGLRRRDPAPLRQPGRGPAAVAGQLRLAGEAAKAGPTTDGVPPLRRCRDPARFGRQGVVAGVGGLGAAAGAFWTGPPPAAARLWPGASGVVDCRVAGGGRGAAGGDRGRELRRTVKENPSMSTAPEAFWIDGDYDREYASDGISRYGAYLRDATFEPWTDDGQAVEWAVFAWRRATGPGMSPGYVRYHVRVLAARLERSGWDGSLVAGVTLISSWPEQFNTAPARSVKRGDKDAYWQAWPAESRGGTTCHYEPSESDVAAQPYLL